jgi:hypothetical protein
MENTKEENKDSKSLGQKIKIGVIVAGLIIIGLFSGYVLGVMSYLKIIGPYVSEMKYKAFLADYLKPYQEDVVGGETPEETIDLFIEALKKEDYELASKYFVIEKQKNVAEALLDKNKISIVEELEYAKKNWKKESASAESVNFWYNTSKENISMTNEIILAKNVNNKWKIESMYIYYLAE